MPDRKALAAATVFGVLSLGACGGSSAPTSTDAGSDIAQSTNRAVTLAMACSGCHADPGGAIVSLQGYDESTLRELLTRYQSEPGGTTVMHRLARGYSDEEIALLSQHLATEGSGE